MPTQDSELPPPKPTKVALKDIAVVDAIQPRDHMSRDAVQTYARIYRSKPPGSLPPITLGRISGQRKLVLLDGFHRVEAAREAHVTHLQAYVYDTDEKEALWLAVSENLKHGLRLKGTDRRTVFKRFVNAGRNRNADGGLMSSRELAQTLGLGSHATMLSWMKKEFPKIAAEMTRQDPDEVEEEAGDGQQRREDQLFANLNWAEKQYLKALAKTLKGVPKDRVIMEVGDIASKVEGVLAMPQGTLADTLAALEKNDLEGDF